MITERETGIMKDGQLGQSQVSSGIEKENCKKRKKNSEQVKKTNTE